MPYRNADPGIRHCFVTQCAQILLKICRIHDFTFSMTAGVEDREGVRTVISIPSSARMRAA